MSKKTSGKSSGSGGLPPRLTKKQEQVLGLLKKGLTVAGIAQLWSSDGKVTESNKRAIRHHVAALKQIGVWSETSGNLPEKGPISTAEENLYRVHDFVLSLPVHYAKESYHHAVRKGNFRRIDGHKIQLYPNSITIHGAKDFGFYGLDHNDAMAQSHEYWERLVRRVENWYGVVLFKHDCVFEMSYETAETNNDFAEQQGKQKEWLKIRTTEDGKVWLTLDHSFTYEAETVHGRTAGEDMQRVVSPYFNNLRDNQQLLRLPTTAWAMHDDLTEKQLRLAGSINKFVAAVEQLAQMQTQFFEAQTAMSRAQSKIFEAQMPRDVQQESDFSELRRWT